jgi:hypothetical protein
MLSFELLCNVVANWIFYEEEVEMLLTFHVFKSRLNFFFKWEFNVLRNSMCLCGFIEKNIDVYPFNKHSKVSTNFQYGCCLLKNVMQSVFSNVLIFKLQVLVFSFCLSTLCFFNVLMNCKLLIGGIR